MKQLKDSRIMSVIGMLAIAVVITLAATSLGQVASAQSPTTTPPAEEEAPPPPADETWSRIQETGEMVVGTSLPYPPFEYRTPLFRLDGFDIALMEEIGERLGVEIRFKDYAFDGLFGALSLGTLDAAISAIDVTPVRSEQATFSNLYYLGAGAALIEEQSALISLDSVSDLAGLRVAVQAGSVYETWLEQVGPLAGLDLAADIFAYDSLANAVEELKLGQIDLVLMDYPAARDFILTGGVRVIRPIGPTQRYAIALPLGAAALKAEIDTILAEMDQDGALDRLAAAYGLAPLPLPEPGCINDLTFLESVTYDDENMASPPVVEPTELFAKVWLVENSGACTWNPTYRLVYAYGNTPFARMGGRPVYVTEQVAPGETYEIRVDLTAPAAGDVYQGVWQMEDGLGRPFGEKIYVGVSVPETPTPTPSPTLTPTPTPSPTPTQTPSPDINFIVDDTTIEAGDCVTFSWNVSNVQEVYFYPEGESWEDRGVAGQDAAEACPAQTTTYILRVVKRDGSIETPRITIEVEQTAEAPVIESGGANPAEISVGECTNISWQVSGEVDKVVILANNRAIWDGAPLSGNINDCPPGAGTIVYAVEATGPGGTSRQETSVTVAQPAEPTPPPAAPVIQVFTAEPTEIRLGECVTLVWEFSGDSLASAVITANEAPILTDPPPTGTISSCPEAAGEVLYRLDVTAEFGGRASGDARVTVQPQ